MKIYDINPENFGNYKHEFAQILKKPNLFGAFSKGCGHCQTMKPQWEELKQKLSNEKCGAGVVELDSGIVPHIPFENIKKHVNGYPTILIIKNGSLAEEYRGNRSTDDMYNFCKKHLFDKSQSQSQSRRKQHQSKRKHSRFGFSMFGGKKSRRRSKRRSKRHSKRHSRRRSIRRSIRRSRRH